MSDASVLRAMPVATGPARAALVAAATLLLASSPALAVVEVVSPANVEVDWFQADTRAGGSVSFEPGPGLPPHGAASLHLATTDSMGGSSQAKANLFTYACGSLGTPGDGVLLADVDAIDY